MNNIIKYTQSDNAPMTFTCPGVDLTGATITVAFKNVDPIGSDIIVSGGQIVIDPDQVTNKGKFTVTPTSIQSAQFALGPDQDILVKVVQSGTQLTFRGKKKLSVFKSTQR